MRLILASASPRRAELLRAAGFDFDVHPVDVDERTRAAEPAAQYVHRLAMEKSARAMVDLSPAQAGLGRTTTDGAVVVLAADTAVVVGDDILGKPRDAEDAARMLRRLSGRSHEVMTGVSMRSLGLDLSFVETTEVTFDRLTEEQVAWYVATGEGNDKAGAYAIQGLAARFIPRIEGSYSNVVGLPIAGIERLMHRFSVLASGG